MACRNSENNSDKLLTEAENALKNFSTSLSLKKRIMSKAFATDNSSHSRYVLPACATVLLTGLFLVYMVGIPSQYHSKRGELEESFSEDEAFDLLVDFFEFDSSDDLSDTTLDSWEHLL